MQAHNLPQLWWLHLRCYQVFFHLCSWATPLLQASWWNHVHVFEQFSVTFQCGQNLVHLERLCVQLWRDIHGANGSRPNLPWPRKEKWSDRKCPIHLVASCSLCLPFSKRLYTWVRTNSRTWMATFIKWDPRVGPSLYTSFRTSVRYTYPRTAQTSPCLRPQELPLDPWTVAGVSHHWGRTRQVGVLTEGSR